MIINAFGPGVWFRKNVLTKTVYIVEWDTNVFLTRNNNSLTSICYLSITLNLLHKSIEVNFLEYRVANLNGERQYKLTNFFSYIV